MKRDEPLGYNLHHLQFYTTTSLHRLLEAEGFEVLELSTQFKMRNRRTLTAGQNRWVRIAKHLLYWGGGYIGRGPNIEAFVRKI